MNWKLPKYLMELAEHLLADDQGQWASVCEEAAGEIAAMREFAMNRKWPIEIEIEEGDRANG